MKRRTVMMTALGWALMPRLAAAHPYHTSSAVADVRGRRLEVTLTVTPEDLQEALRRQAGRVLHIDSDPKVDALARAYAEQRFVVSGPEGDLPMTWVGCEIEPDTARLYFAFDLPKDRAAVTLRSGVFFEIAPAQINRVLVRWGKTQRTLRFRADDGAKKLLEPTG